DLSVTRDLERDACCRPLIGHRGERNGRAERARTRVDLGLGQIERVLALDIATAHVVADGDADNLHGWIHDQRQFRLGHIPVRIAADAYLAVGADYPGSARLEKDLRARGGVDARIDIAAVDCLFLARGAAAFVGDAGSPYILLV